MKLEGIADHPFPVAHSFNLTSAHDTTDISDK